MLTELLPIREASLESVRYAADRADDKIRFTDEALKTILHVPRVFLPLVLKGCVEWGRENGVELIDVEHMQIINDKCSKEKNKSKSKRALREAVLFFVTIYTYMACEFRGFTAFLYN